MSQLSLNCPHCKSSLPVRYMPAAGTQVQCPRCRATFAVQASAASQASGAIDSLGAGSAEVVKATLTPQKPAVSRPAAPKPAAGRPAQTATEPPAWVGPRPPAGQAAGGQQGTLPTAQPLPQPLPKPLARPVAPAAGQQYPGQQPGYPAAGYPQPGYPQGGYPQGGYPPAGYPGGAYDPLQKPLPAAVGATGSNRGLIIAAIAGSAVVGMLLIGVVVAVSLGGRKQDPIAANSTSAAPNYASSATSSGSTPSGAATPFSSSSYPSPTIPQPTIPAASIPVPTTPAAPPVATGSAPPPPPPANMTASGLVPGAGPAASSLASISSDPASIYRFDAGKMAHYSFTLENPSRASRTFGAIYYRVDPVAQDTIRERNENVSEVTGTGTAFVVHRDGLLVTCAHVVEGAKSIEVKIGEETFPADLIAIDSVRDLAVVRVNVRNLTELPLGDSQALQLAEEVRAVGFPLASQLGESVKITRGTLSGRVDEPSGELLQIDAPINPGNSGGPLVNEQGNVVGVCSSGLVGEAISNVGFACPIADVAKMLSKIGVTLVSRPRTEKLDGPRLARMVTPSVALVKVKSAGTAGLQAVEYSGYMAEQQNGGLGPQRRETSKLLLAHNGEVLASKGDLQLPYQHGRLGDLIFQQLGNRGQKEWTVRSTSAVSLTIPTTRTGMPPGIPGGPRFGPRGMPGSQSTVVLPAIEQSSYELVSDGDEMRVKKKYTFIILGGEDIEAGEELLKAEGSGEFVFDTKQGLPREMSFETKFTGPSSARREEFTTKLTWTLKEVVTSTSESMVPSPGDTSPNPIAGSAPPNLPALPAMPVTPSFTPPAPPTPSFFPSPRGPGLPNVPGVPAVASGTPAAPAPAASSRGKEVDPKKLDEIVTALKSPDDSFAVKYLPVTQLALMEPVESRRDEISGLLDRLLTVKQQSVRSSAINAVAKWGTPKNIPTLLKLCDELDLGTRWGAMRALGGIGGSAEAAAKVATLMGDQEDMLTAADALKKMGAHAEEPVWQHLKPDNVQLFLQATYVIEQVGTARSIPALEPFANHEHISIRSRTSSLLTKLKTQAGLRP